MLMDRDNLGFSWSGFKRRMKGATQVFNRKVFGRTGKKLQSRRYRKLFSKRANLMRRAVLSRPPVRRKARGRRLFLQWLRRVDPRIYNRAMLRVDINRRVMGRGVGDLDLEDQGLNGLWDDIKGSVSDVIKTGLQMKQQRDLYKLQLARAERGLPPLDASKVAPVIRTQIEIGPETRGQLFSEVGGMLKTYALPIAAGVGALMWIRKK